jgi:hypothetical protein
MAMTLMVLLATSSSRLADGGMFNGQEAGARDPSPPGNFVTGD